MKWSPDKFAEILKDVREMDGMTQEDLAKATGLQPAAISHYETGRRTPNIKNLCLLANALRISPGDLLSPINEFKSTP